MISRIFCVFIILNSFLAAGVEAQSQSLVLCSNRTSGALAIRTSKCGRTELRLKALRQLVGATGPQGTQGPTGAVGTTGPAGSQGQSGPTGEPGADGALRIYGDGTAGALIVSSSTSLNTANTQFTDITINEGQVLTVPSGTVLRCTGTFVNNGAIYVTEYAQGGLTRTTESATPAIEFNRRPAHPGASASVAEDPEMGTDAAVRYGAFGGVGLTEEKARGILRTGPLGGGGGGGAYSRSGGAGGGTLTVICAGAITNNGLVRANGETSSGSSGGGAGGLIVFGSATSVANPGVLSANGGSGGPCASYGSGGGGGGGGIIHLIAPSISVTGSLSVGGGAGGASGASIVATVRSGGGGGGAFGGDGGSGGNVGTSGECLGGTAGGIGHSYQTTANPTSLLL